MKKNKRLKKTMAKVREYLNERNPIFDLVPSKEERARRKLPDVKGEKRKLYTVVLQTSIVVVAENADHAAEIATGQAFDLGDTVEWLEPLVSHRFYVPDNWEEEMVPFGTRQGDPGYTISDWKRLFPDPRYT